MPLTVIQGVRLFDGVRLHDDPASVTFDSTTGLIVSIGTGPSTQAEGATVIDGKGHTLLPGLIEAHVHVHGEHLHDHGGDHAGPESLRHMFHSGIKCGITTICDMFSDLEAVERYRGWLAQEKAEGGSVGDHVEVLPDLKTSLYGATIEGGWPKPIVLGRDPKPEVSESWSLSYLDCDTAVFVFNYFSTFHLKSPSWGIGILNCCVSNDLAAHNLFLGARACVEMAELDSRPSG